MIKDICYSIKYLHIMLYIHINQFASYYSIYAFIQCINKDICYSILFLLEQHPGGAQQIAGPPAHLLICQWEHSDQLSF